jgi:Cu/Zn superoxide dismutase
MPRQTQRSRRPQRRSGVYRFTDYPDFTPNLSPREMFELGSFGGTYWRPIHSSVTGKDYKNQHKKYPAAWWKGIPEDHLTRPFEEYDTKINKYGKKVGTTLEYWEEKGWIKPTHPYGWVEWYCDFFQGKRGPDDERQIARWAGLAGPKGRFRNWLINEIRRKGKRWDDESVSPAKRQTLQHWAYRLTKEDFSKSKTNSQKGGSQRGGKTRRVSKRQQRKNNHTRRARQKLRASLGTYGIITINPTSPPTLAYELKELTEGDHGFHIHVKGSQGYGKECQKAGPHYNPKHKVHGGPKSHSRHVGDLGNVRANSNGVAKGVKTMKGVKDLKELRGRSVIVHAEQDDLGRGRGDEKKESEKTGNAGARLACGILKWVS